MKKIKLLIKNNKLLFVLFVPIYRLLKRVFNLPKQYSLFRKTRSSLLAKSNKKRIYYIGCPVHSNLGDLAQGVCIRWWMQKNYPNRTIVEIETNAVVNTCFSVLKILKQVYSKDDFIIFQSGYTTTDLGGYADEMHCAIINALPQARILMMPQTIFFQSNDRRKQTSETYSKAKKMLFLARDRISFEMAKEMFPKTQVGLYPDIVTTLIGKYHFSNKREGILFCCRDDSEQFYSDVEINNLMARCNGFANVEKTDTTKSVNKTKIANNTEQYIMDEIERYSRYKLIITDRYHGTIFSLVAGTPVIVLKTTDHKVTTGVEWFKGIYDDYVYLSDSLDDAFYHAKEIFNRELDVDLKEYFEEQFYNKLPLLFKQSTSF